jgi:hypothetical protein
MMGVLGGLRLGPMGAAMMAWLLNHSGWRSGLLHADLRPLLAVSLGVHGGLHSGAATMAWRRGWAWNHSDWQSGLLRAHLRPAPPRLQCTLTRSRTHARAYAYLRLLTHARRAGLFQSISHPPTPSTETEDLFHIYFVTFN